jgi:hypothetical protein
VEEWGRKEEREGRGVRNSGSDGVVGEGRKRIGVRGGEKGGEVGGKGTQKKRRGVWSEGKEEGVHRWGDSIEGEVEGGEGGVSTGGRTPAAEQSW